jgi:type II secretory pathway pseudopilin PulG
MSGRKSIREQEGFTIVEVLIAALILVLGSLAVFMTFSGAVKNVQRGKEAQVGLSIAQREMEKVRSLPYDQILLKTTPVKSAVTTNPNNRINGTTFNINRSGAASYAQMAISSAGEVVPTTSAFSVGGARVAVYRYVVWRKDTAYCATGTNSEKESCQTGQNFKRVIIAVLPSKPGNATHTGAYFELQSDFVNPNPTP